MNGDDLPLVQRSLRGDERAFEELISRYEAALYRLAWRMMGNAEEAHDVVQETFLRVFRSLDTFDQSRRFSTWILRIATNLCIDRYRRRKVQLLSIDVDDDDDERRPIVLADERQNPEEMHGRTALAESIGRLMEHLPPIYRAILELRYKQDLAYEEIADVLEIPLGTVKARLHRAHHRLKELLVEAGLRPDADETARSE
ncbi:MAG: sigma-70 family RNA polymerase sigma factor [Candidatus Eisenbacteria bacterium]